MMQDHGAPQQLPPRAPASRPAATGRRRAEDLLDLHRALAECQRPIHLDFTVDGEAGQVVILGYSGRRPGPRHPGAAHAVIGGGTYDAERGRVVLRDRDVVVTPNAVTGEGGGGPGEEGLRKSLLKWLNRKDVCDHLLPPRVRLFPCLSRLMDEALSGHGHMYRHMYGHMELTGAAALARTLPPWALAEFMESNHGMAATGAVHMFRTAPGESTKVAHALSVELNRVLLRAFGTHDRPQPSALLYGMEFVCRKGLQPPRSVLPRGRDAAGALEDVFHVHPAEPGHVNVYMRLRGVQGTGTDATVVVADVREDTDDFRHAGSSTIRVRELDGSLKDLDRQVTGDLATAASVEHLRDIIQRALKPRPPSSLSAHQQPTAWPTTVWDEYDGLSKATADVLERAVPPGIGSCKSFADVVQAYSLRSSRFNAASLSKKYLEAAGVPYATVLEDRALDGRTRCAAGVTFDAFRDALARAMDVVELSEVTRYAPPTGQESRHDARFTVYRGVDFFVPLGGTGQDVYSIPLPFSIKGLGFSSTSVRYKDALDFLPDHGMCCMMVLDVPNGFRRFIPMNDVRLSEFTSEHEVLFMDDAIFVITERAFRDNRRLELRGRVDLRRRRRRPTQLQTGGGSAEDGSVQYAEDRDQYAEDSDQDSHEGYDEYEGYDLAAMPCLDVIDLSCLGAAAGEGCCRSGLTPGQDAALRTLYTRLLDDAAPDAAPASRILANSLVASSPTSTARHGESRRGRGVTSGARGPNKARSSSHASRPPPARTRTTRRAAGSHAHNAARVR
jgi:hypothetical protein